MNSSIQKRKEESTIAISSQSSIDFDPQSIQRLCKNIDLPQKAFNTKLPSLATMRKEFGEIPTMDYIKLWIIDLCEFLNIGKGMNSTQIDRTATIILDEYYALNIADINLVFKRAMTGYYGEIFDRLDGQIILGWFKKYHNERCMAAVDENISRASNYTDRSDRLADREIKRLGEIESRIRR